MPEREQDSARNRSSEFEIDLAFGAVSVAVGPIFRCCAPFPIGVTCKSMDENRLLHEAIAEARQGLAEGGIPIGSVIADLAGNIVARGHNLRVQTGDPTAHAEVVCIRNAGRRTDWDKLTLVSTLSPCIMCTGTALLYRIPRVIIGENQTFLGAEDLFAARGVQCTVLQNKECSALMREFIAANPELWNEDIGSPPDRKVR
jgi:cytosine deaminase